jgi:hypothetical protein
MARSIKPLDRIRRFDVFAEYQKQEHHDDGMPLDQAKGYGLWVAKVVAARKFARMRGRESKPSGDKPPRRRKWRVLSGQPQTDKLFDHQIVSRMGEDFYHDVFEPAIQAARKKGQSYESIRDRIRRSWKPAPAKADD